MANSDHILNQHCKCGLCLNKSLIREELPKFAEKSQNQNCLDIFLQYFPRNFPLPIFPTSVVKTKIHYFNKKTKVPSTNPSIINNFTEEYRLMRLNFNNRIIEHFPVESNLYVFYKDKIKATYKFDLLKQPQQYRYIQACIGYVPLTIHYSNQSHLTESNGQENQQSCDLGELLDEKLEQILKEIQKKQGFQFSDKTREFMNWLQKQYGQFKYCLFMTKLYCLYIYMAKRDHIVKGTFYWVTEYKNNDRLVIRLANVTDLVIEQYKPIYSFQQEYQEKIKEKIDIKNLQEIKLFGGASVRKREPNRRVKDFRSNIKKLYQEEKLKILKNTQKERVVDTKTMSDDIARLFLPDLHHYSSLREVLSDQKKFRKVVLRQKQSKDHLKQIKNRRSNSLYKPLANKSPKYSRLKTQL